MNLAFVFIYLLPFFGATIQQEPVDQLLVKLESSTDTAKVNTLNKLSLAYLASDTDSSIYFAQQGLELAKDLDYVSGEAFSIKQIAQGLIYMGKYDEALGNANQALDLYKSLRDEVGEASVLREIGTVQMYKGDFSAAMENFKKAVVLYENNGNLKGQAASFNALGNVAQKKGDYPQASEYLHKALGISQKLGDKSGEADELNNLGIIYELQDDLDKALANYGDAIAIYKTLNDKLGLAIGLHNAGIILKKTEKYDSAIYNFKRAMTLDLETGSLDGVAYDKKEMGETYLLMGEIDTAYVFLHDALKLSLEFKDPVVSVPTMTGLGFIHQIKNNTDSAIYYLNTAFTRAKEVELKNEQKEAAKALYKLFDQLGNIKKAYEYHRIYHILKESLFSEENIKKLAMVEAEYAYKNRRDQEELQAKLKEAERDRQLSDALWLRNTSIIGILLVALLAVYIYINYRKARKATNELNELHEEVLSQKEELSIQADALSELNNTLEQKVNQRTKQLESKNLQLEIKNEKLANYAFYNAHKLRAPLASIMGLTDLLMNPKVAAKERQEIATKIKASSNVLNEVIQQMRKLLEEE